MAISINQYRMCIGHYHHGKIEVNAKPCNKKALNNAYNTVQKISLTSNIKDIAPSYHACQHRENRSQLKQIICFILLLNQVRAHTMFAGENPDISPPPRVLRKYNKTLPPLNERLHIKTGNMQNPQQYTDDNEKKTVERLEKRPIQ